LVIVTDFILDPGYNVKILKLIKLWRGNVFMYIPCVTVTPFKIFLLKFNLDLNISGIKAVSEVCIHSIHETAGERRC